VITQLLPDIPRELTGIAEWAACLIYVLLQRKRLRWRRLVPVLALALGAQIGVQMLAGTFPLTLWSFGMALAVGVMFVTIWSAARITVREAGYFCARALVLAELVAALHWQLHCYFFADGEHPLVLRGLVFGLVYVGAFTVAWLIESRHFRPDTQLDITRRDLASAAAIAGVTFLVSNLSFLTANSPFSGRLGLEIFYIRTLVDLCGFVALYAQQGQRLQLRARADVKAVDEMLRRQHEQYLQSKRSIEVVDRKYHDLKHQIAVLRAESDEGKRASYLDDLEASVSGYAAQARTGNGVLDVILTSKSLECAEKGVDLTYVADGATIDFMSAMDVSAVFGNALDNAIDAVMAVPEPEKRLIKVALYATGGFVLATFENYFSGTLRTEDGAIVTRRADRDRHGYGLKSIRHTAEKYGGSMTVSADDSWFALRILLPVPATSRTDDPGALAR
jgi:hypothetical protein